MLLRGLAARLKVRQKYMDIMAPYAKRVRKSAECLSQNTYLATKATSPRSGWQLI